MVIRMAPYSYLGSCKLPSTPAFGLTIGADLLDKIRRVPRWGKARRHIFPRHGEEHLERTPLRVVCAAAAARAGFVTSLPGDALGVAALSTCLERTKMCVCGATSIGGAKLETARKLH